jgi:hypothetical protein
MDDSGTRLDSGMARHTIHMSMSALAAALADQSSSISHRYNLVYNSSTIPAYAPRKLGKNVDVDFM